MAAFTALAPLRPRPTVDIASLCDVSRKLLISQPLYHLLDIILLCPQYQLLYCSSLLLEYHLHNIFVAWII